MNVHTAARLAVNRLGHKGCRLAILESGVVDDIFDHHRSICHLGHFSKLRLDFKLTGCSHFGMVIIDFNARIFHMQAHLAAALVGNVKGLCNVIVLLLGNDHTVACNRAVPIGLTCIHLNADAVGLHFPTNVIEKIKFKFGKNEHGVGNAAILHILLCRQNDVAGVLRQGSVFGSVDDHRVTRHGKRGNGAERINESCVGIGDKYHITLFYNCIAVVGSIKADATLHCILGEIFGRNGNVAVLTVDVNHLKVDHLNAIDADHFQNIFYGFFHNRYLT